MDKDEQFVLIDREQDRMNRLYRMRTLCATMTVLGSVMVLAECSTLLERQLRE